jgi:peptide/nickel transport system permease protein
MIRYVFKRILQLIPVIIAVSFIVFALMDMLPGDVMTGWNLEKYTQEEIAALRASLGLDDPLLIRYGRYMFQLIQGNLGVSDVSGINVLDMFLSKLPNTLLLIFSSFIIGLVIAIPLGVWAARRAGTVTDNLITAVSMIGMSMPGFWLGILLILLFAHRLPWFPIGGFRAGAASLVLPSVVAAMPLVATCARQTRSSMLEVLNSDYLRTARAKGIPERVVIRKHALGNALIPIVTSVGISLGGALASSAVVETVFAWPGIGRLVVEDVLARDVTATTGAVILTTILYCLVQLTVDILYAFIDPKIKAKYVSKGRARGRAGKPAAAKDPSDLSAPALSAETALADEDDVSAMIAARIDGGLYEAMLAQADGSIPIHEPEPIQSVSSTRGLHVGGGDEEPAVAGNDLTARKYKKRSQVGEVIHHLMKNPGAIAGIAVISVIVLLYIAAQFIPFEAVTETNISLRYRPPGAAYLFGTDGMGRDVFIRVVYAAKFSLPIGFGATALSALTGILLGTHASYFGGIVDDVIMRASDTLASIPGLIAGMVIIFTMGRSLTNLIIAVSMATIPVFIRISRASTLTVVGAEYVEAARAIGLSNLRIILTQVLPNGLAPIIVTFSTSLGNSILISASLSFLGLGIPIPNPEWGSLVAAGRDVIAVAPWLSTIPGLVIVLTVMGFNMLGDGLRDALDPKQKRR